MIEKEYKANRLHDAYIDLKSAYNDLQPLSHDQNVVPLLNEIASLRNKLQKAYEKAFDEIEGKL